MARGSSNKNKNKGRKFEIAERETAEVNPYTARHGDYGPMALVTGPGELGNGSRYGSSQVIRNRGASTVDRWIYAGTLDPGQADAVRRYAAKHRLVYGTQRVTAKLDDTPRGESTEESANRRLDAKKWLDAVDSEVFRHYPIHFADVWKNVVLHDEAAGVAGSRLGYKSAAAEGVARLIVQTVAWRVSTLRVRFDRA